MENGREFLEFRHFVIDRKGFIFASARDSSNKIHNFLITRCGILEQFGNHFARIRGQQAAYVREGTERCYGVLPTYEVNKIELS